MSTKIFGLHAASAALGKQTITQAYLLLGRGDVKLQAIQKQLEKKRIAIQLLDRKAMDAMVDGANHQGVILEVSTTKQYNEGDIDILLVKEYGSHEQATGGSGVKAGQNSGKIILILDGVQDPHNLGACLRSANAFGVDIVLAPKDNAVGLTPTVKKIACGGAEAVPFIQVTNLARIIKKLQDSGFWVYGLVGGAKESIFNADLKGNIAIVMGAEGKGLRALTQKACDNLYHIPMVGSVESLNVSVATGICLAESIRQRS